MFGLLQASKTYLGKSLQTSGNEYLVTIKRNDNKKSMRFHYHDNYYNDSNLMDFIYCILLDASCYEDDPVLEHFNAMWSYDDNKVYYGCKRHYKMVHNFFTNEEITELNLELENAGY